MKQININVILMVISFTAIIFAQWVGIHAADLGTEVAFSSGRVPLLRHESNVMSSPGMCFADCSASSFGRNVFDSGGSPPISPAQMSSGHRVHGFEGSFQPTRLAIMGKPSLLSHREEVLA